MAVSVRLAVCDTVLTEQVSWVLPAALVCTQGRVWQVGVVTRLLDGRYGVRVPGRQYISFSSKRPDRRLDPPAIPFNRYRSYTDRFLNLTTHLHLVPRVGMSGARHLPPLHLDELDRDNCSFTIFSSILWFYAVDRDLKFLISTNRETVSSSAGHETACTFTEPKATAACRQEPAVKRTNTFAINFLCWISAAFATKCYKNPPIKIATPLCPSLCKWRFLESVFVKVDVVGNSLRFVGPF